MINRKQLTALFICSLVPWSAGYGLLPLLPVYAKQFGANQAVSGYILSFAYLAITLGAFSAGWVSNGFKRRKLPLLVAGIINVPTAWIAGHIQTILGLTLITAFIWYLGGLMLALISILTGLSAGEKERGKVFGILAMTMGLGMLMGGLGIGWLVDHYGFTAMFNILMIFLALLPLTAIFLEEKEVKQSTREEIAGRRTPGLGKNFYLLFSATISGSIIGFFAMFIRTIAMNSLHFNALEINSTVAVAGIVVITFPFLMGWLSDRVGRKLFLLIGYFSSLVSFIWLSFSRVLWNFWLVFIGQGISTATAGVGNALVTDLIPHESLGKGLSTYASASWIGGMVGFSLAGFLLQNLSLTLTFIIGSCFGLAAILLLMVMSVRSSSITEPDYSKSS